MHVGVLGGGQLAGLLALAGKHLGVTVTCLDPAPDACAAAVTRMVCAPLDDEAALVAFAAKCDVVTYEVETVPVNSVRRIEALVPVRPGADALEIAADRVREKTLFRSLGMATANFAAVDSEEQLAAALSTVGLPARLKTRRAGYDGKGQAAIREAADLRRAWQQLGGVPAILEQDIAFDRELSIIAARGQDRRIACYPLSENLHRDGILRLAASQPGHPLQARAEGMVTALMASLDYIGVLALELFQSGDRLVASEFAPRVHNSGHWTPQGAATSQFENHLRAILGLPLGPTSALGAAATVNFIGRLPSLTEVLSIPQARLHAYGKVPRPGRKVGHATVHAPDTITCQQLAGRLLEMARATGDG